MYLKCNKLHTQKAIMLILYYSTLQSLESKEKKRLYTNIRSIIDHHFLFMVIISGEIIRQLNEYDK